MRTDGVDPARIPAVLLAAERVLVAQAEGTWPLDVHGTVSAAGLLPLAERHRVTPLKVHAYQVPLPEVNPLPVWHHKSLSSGLGYGYIVIAHEQIAVGNMALSVWAEDD